MTRVRVSLALAAVAGALVLPAGQAAAAEGPIRVSVDRVHLATKLGKRVVFRSTIANDGARPASGLIAHLNILSLGSGVYVDPEDWSSNRTRYLAPIPAGSSSTVTWPMHAVNGGAFAVYVAVVDRPGGARPPEVGPTIRLDVAERRVLNSGGILPLALGVPAGLLALLLSTRLRRRA